MGKEHEQPAELTQEKIKELADFGVIASRASPFFTFPVLLLCYNDLVKGLGIFEKQTSISKK